ncbi:hypothetical protein V8942_11925 [Acinetobacter baumannii]|uniref:hypothetical protein n=1 Tax=Acinetobacter baumannii TaxID=470 RepID=UPI00300C6125|nr:hypothetical protein [Acinetobacter baumannii]
MSFDMQKIRREGMRWHLLNALDKARPLGALDTLLLDVMRALYPDTTPQELHVQLDYLEERKLVEIKKNPDGHWHAKLDRLGIDIVEYTIDCQAGITRPEKYWN